MGANWEGVESEFTKDANVISSHVIFKVMTNEDGSFLLKGRIVVDGNRDTENDMARSDSVAAEMMTVRLVIILA